MSKTEQKLQLSQTKINLLRQKARASRNKAKTVKMYAKIKELLDKGLAYRDIARICRCSTFPVHYVAKYGVPDVYARKYGKGLTPVEAHAAIELREQGEPLAAIAYHLDSSPYQVYKILPEELKKCTRTPNSKPRLDDEAILKLRKSGMTRGVIASILNCSMNGVDAALKRSGEDVSQYKYPDGRGRFDRKYDYKQILNMLDQGMTQADIGRYLMCTESVIANAIKKGE